MSETRNVAFKTVNIDNPRTKNRIDWRFDEFHERRASRGAPAARVYIDQNDGQGETWLWMYPHDIENNIKEFGDHPELQKALAAYRSFEN